MRIRFSLFEVRGISKRTKKPVDLSIEQCFIIIGLLPEPYRTMATTALCTGTRIEEILALDWVKIHFDRLCTAVTEGYGGIGWHAFRHKYRTLLSGEETPLEVQQKLMRQADIRTTIGYGGVPMENKRSANSQVVRAILHRKSER